jgi:hypothetical protein
VLVLAGGGNFQVDRHRVEAGTPDNASCWQDCRASDDAARNNEKKVSVSRVATATVTAMEIVTVVTTMEKGKKERNILD